MRVLVVEDEQKIANAIKKGLEQEMYAVDAVYTGIEGFDLAMEEEYDVIVLDVMLPDMDGMDIVKRLREKNIHTPIILLTARSQTNDKVAGLDIGADDYLTKPFSFDELLARIRALIRRPRVSEKNVLRIEELEMDTRNLTVKRSGKTVKLSAKEYALLQFMMRHPNQILSKEKIIANVWGYDDNILPNTVEVYLGYLRNKIDKPFSDNPPLIHTLRGFGYKMGEEE
jgi:DNA-binding response OmpR family regulator